jgi:hypothetical protein
MKKVNILWIIFDLIFLAIFNVLFFVLGGVEHNTAVWMSFAFIHFAYFMLILTPLLIRKGKSRAIFDFSLYSISSVYFFVELITGAIFVLVAPESYKAALLVQLIIAGLYGVLLIFNMIANEHTADAQEARQNQLAYVKGASAKLKILLGNITDREAKKKVESVYDAVQSSPVKSHHNLSQIENGILQAINNLEIAVSNGNKDDIISLSDSLLGMTNERNTRLKALN